SHCTECTKRGRPDSERRLARSIDRRVQRRIVVHLQLPVNLETPRSGEDLFPEPVEAGDEVVTLFRQQPEAFAIALFMSCRSTRTADLLAGVVELQREDREAVDHQ